MSPFGVNTKTWSWKMSSLMPSTNSVASDSDTSRCQSMSWRSQASLASYSRSDLRAFLVAPVRGDADLGDLVHLVGPDLDLERLAVDAR